MEDNFIEDLFESEREEISKPFSQIFKIENAKLGTQMSVLIPISIKENYYEQGRIFYNPDISVNGIPLYELQSKNLKGWVHRDSNVFYITGYE